MNQFSLRKAVGWQIVFLNNINIFSFYGFLSPILLVLWTLGLYPTAIKYTDSRKVRAKFENR